MDSHWWWSSDFRLLVFTPQRGTIYHSDRWKRFCGDKHDQLNYLHEFPPSQQLFPGNWLLFCSLKRNITVTIFSNMKLKFWNFLELKKIFYFFSSRIWFCVPKTLQRVLERICCPICWRDIAKYDRVIWKYQISKKSRKFEREWEFYIGILQGLS